MILIGTIHTDLEGPRRLSALLEYYQPKKITVEIPKAKSISETIELFRKINNEMQELVNNRDISDNLKQFAKKIFETEGYELFVTANYCKKSGAELYFVDLPELIELWQSADVIHSLKFIETALKQNPKIAEVPSHKLVETHQTKIDKIYCDVKFFEDYIQNTLTFKKVSELNRDVAEELTEYFSKVVSATVSEERDKFMAEEIRRIIPDTHIGGLAHVLQGFNMNFIDNPLYKLLGEIKYKTVLLSDADLLPLKNQNI